MQFLIDHKAALAAALSTVLLGVSEFLALKSGSEKASGILQAVIKALGLIK